MSAAIRSFNKSLINIGLTLPFPEMAVILRQQVFHPWCFLGGGDSSLHSILSRGATPMGSACAGEETGSPSPCLVWAMKF